MESADLSALMESGEGGHRSPTIADFALSKQELYNSIGDLVIASQEITTEEQEPKGDMSGPPRSRARRGTLGTRNVIKAAESIKTKVHSVCLNICFMVEEDKSRRQKTTGYDTSPPSFLNNNTPTRYAPKLVYTIFV